jgi:hypothetical protein
MQKNDKFYTFHLSHQSKSKLYIRRVEISPKYLHISLVALFLILGLTTFSFTSIFNNNSIAESEIVNSNTPVEAVQTIASVPNYKSINYSHPVKNESIAVSAGGPATTIDMDTEAVVEEPDMENRMRSIQSVTSAAFLPTVWAHLGKINNEYGYRRNPFNGRGYEFHGGIDIDGNKGDTVMAPANGIVSKAGWHGGYGNLIEIDHGNGLTTRYGHLSQGNVRIGDTVQRGQLIGLIGSTGRSTGPHLHYELRMNDKPINPRRLLPPLPIN